MMIRCVMVFWFLREVLCQTHFANYFQSVNTTSISYITSPGYPLNYNESLSYQWVADCPSGFNCLFDCPLIEIPQSKRMSCEIDQLLVSKSGDQRLADADTYCGRRPLSVVSIGQRIVVALKTSQNTPGGRFMCQVTAQPATSRQQCRCGERKKVRQKRVVGGQTTGVNEYNMMGGIIDVNTRQIKCGAVIISNKYLLTAATCVDDSSLNDILVVVGEHNVTTGNDTPDTQQFKVAKIIIHPLYDRSNKDYDIAIVKVAVYIQFSDQVLPVCLPFKFGTKNFTGSTVTALGWGTLFSGGPTSDVLMKVDVNVLSQSECGSRVGRKIPPNQLCTYTAGKDTCQDDTGGPLLYTDRTNDLLYNVGIVGYGRSCASGQPTISTRVTAFLEWILSNTLTDYCKK